MGVPINYNLRNLIERKGTTLMTAVGIGLTVAVLVTSIAMTRGMAAVFAGSGHPLQMLVLRKGTDAETYAKEVVMADFEEAGDDDVFRKVRKDLDDGGVAATDQEIRTVMVELRGKAVEQSKNG